VINELLRAKRDGGTWSREEVRELALGIGDGTLSDAQVGAFAMVAFLRGLDPDERAALTGGLRDSGEVLEWDRPALDKHSTGGVGDKVSLILAPVVAACGYAVPMISGRGLGHTGGTLDKLESIPGYDATPDLDTLRRVVTEAGCAIVGQTAELAPADGRLYAVRDAVGAVESIGLITASILSKKLAAGLSRLVLDVKHGSGAFMAELGDARELARSLVDVATANGLPCTALLTDMDSVLGTTAGNALEVRESLDVLRAGIRTDSVQNPALVEVTLALAAELVPRADAEEALRSGAAAERFARMVHALGGRIDELPEAPVVRAVFSAQAGYVQRHRTRDIGLLITALGGGRTKESDTIDPRVGLAEVAPVGAAVDGERPLAIVHAADEAAADMAERRLRDLIAVGEEHPAPRPVVTERVE
jgi:thymidine phosphorylase